MEPVSWETLDILLAVRWEEPILLDSDDLQFIKRLQMRSAASDAFRDFRFIWQPRVQLTNNLSLAWQSV